MMKSSLLVVFTLTIPITLIEILNSSKPRHPYAGLTIEELVENYGYGIESYEVVTDDGYILTLHRIPHGREKTNQKRIPILLMHGFAQSAKDFVNFGPDRGLGLILADKGYDVWLGNSRGNTWSKKHVTLDPEDKKFWDFSMHETGVFDVPAFIDHIVAVTGQDSLQYVGYSQGTQVFFILGSEKPQYLKKIRFMTALAPAMFIKDPLSPIVSVAVPLRKGLESELSLIHANTPAGASPKQLLHIAQLMASGGFHQYDLGRVENLEKYGQEEPPHYDLSKIDTPVAIYYSGNDYSINIKNIDKVEQSLSNIIKSYKVPMDAFSHSDFIYSKDVVELLYNEVVEEILRH